MKTGDKYDKGRYQEEKKEDTYICVQIITSRPSPHDARIHTHAKCASTMVSKTVGKTPK